MKIRSVVTLVGLARSDKRALSQVACTNMEHYQSRKGSYGWHVLTSAANLLPKAANF